MYNLIILNHFYGYPALENKNSNKLRYSKLLKLIDIINSNNTIFLSNNEYKKDKKFDSIKKISKGYGHNWLEYNDHQTIDEIIKDIEIQFKFVISSKNANIILGGTNTAGCLLRTSNISATNWALKNYNVQFCLSICTDYELDGISTVEKNQMATAILFTHLKKHGFTNNIDVFYDPRELNITENFRE